MPAAALARPEGQQPAEPHEQRAEQLQRQRRPRVGRRVGQLHGAERLRPLHSPVARSSHCARLEQVQRQARRGVGGEQASQRDAEGERGRPPLAACSPTAPRARRARRRGPRGARAGDRPATSRCHCSTPSRASAAKPARRATCAGSIVADGCGGRPHLAKDGREPKAVAQSCVLPPPSVSGARSRSSRPDDPPAQRPAHRRPRRRPEGDLARAVARRCGSCTSRPRSCPRLRRPHRARRPGGVRARARAARAARRARCSRSRATTTTARRCATRSRRPRTTARCGC